MKKAHPRPAWRRYHAESIDAHPCLSWPQKVTKRKEPMVISQGASSPQRSPKSRGRRIGLIAAAILAAGGATAVSIPAASAATRLGGVDMNAACLRQQTGSYATFSRWDAFSWRCNNSSSYGVDMDRACRDQYGNGAYARFSDRWDAFSWYCER